MLAARLSPHVCDTRLFRYATRSEGRDAHWTGVPVDAPTLHGRTPTATAVVGLAAATRLALKMWSQRAACSSRSNHW